MTPELQQAIALLALSAAEVHDFVSQELADNPCLEFEEGTTSDAITQPETALAEDWDGAWDSWATADDSGANGPAGALYQTASGSTSHEAEDGESWLNQQAKPTTVQDYLQQQFDEITESLPLRLAARFLIDGLDDAGYLRLDIAAVAAQLRLPEEVVDDARAILQTLEPPGIAARSLAECLRLQLHARGQLDVVCETCVSHLDLVAKKDYAALARLARAASANATADCTDEDDVMLAIAELQQCNPKPATTLGLTSARIESVTPDVVVLEGPKGLEVTLNAAAFPRLLTTLPLGASEREAPTQAKKYLTERLGRAKWLIGALEQRARNTLAVARAIVAAQPTFFTAGADFLVPLTLRTVADTVGLHESTVSRVVSGKFMQTSFGVVPLRQFFASGVATTGGQEGVAASSVQSMIAKLVKAEDPHKPLSDEAIVGKLKSEGVVLARRTVAKYRGILNIPGTAERRVR